MIECPLVLDAIKISEEGWDALDLEAQVKILKEDDKYLITEYMKCALRQVELVKWNRVN